MNTTSAADDYKEEMAAEGGGQLSKNIDSKGHLIGNTEAEGHFHRLFQVNSNVLARTKETLESYLVKRIA